MIFLCWFGAAGYLLTRFGGFVASVVVALAMLCGVAGGAIVFFFLAKVLLPHDHDLTADETPGARRSAPARAEDGEPIQKQEEVYVVRYEKGIAWVRRWEDLLEASDQLSVVSGQLPRQVTASDPGSLKSGN